MEDNEPSCDRLEQSPKRGMSNKSLSIIDSSSKIQDESRGSTPISPLRMPDLPLPTPPPMANIMMTSRIGYRRILGSRSSEFRSPILGSRSHSMDFSSRGPIMYGKPENIGGRIPNVPLVDSRRQDFDYFDNKPRNIDIVNRSQTLDSRRQVLRENRANTVEFMSPILARAYLYHRQHVEDPCGGSVAANKHQALLTDQLGLSPLPRHKNFENLSERMEDFQDYPLYPHLYNLKSPEFVRDKSNNAQEQKSKYFSRDSLLSNELEEVRTLNQKLQSKYIGDDAEDNISRILEGSNSETSPEYYSVFMNEHYISDIDENEEIKEFVCGYKAPERRYSDQSERSLSTKNLSGFQTVDRYQTATLPAPPKSSSTKKCSKKANKNNASDTFTNPNIKKSVLKSTKTSQRRNIGLPRTSSEDLILTRKPVQNPTKKILKNTHSDPLGIPGAYSRNSDIQFYSASVHSHHSGSASSMKSSDYYSFVPVATSSAKKVEFSGDSTGKVIKSPQRTVMKLAKIR